MRTIEVNLFTFDELSDEAKQRAMSDFEPDNSYYWDDAHQSVIRFHEIFGTRDGYCSWLDISTGHMDDCILELTGFRLQKYLWNNFFGCLFKGKWHSVKANHVIRHKRVKSTTYKNGNVVNSYRSAIFFEHSCVLTGVCYDEDILEPVYSFMVNRNADKLSTTFESLMVDCLYSLRKSLESEYDYRFSDEGKSEDLSDSNAEFLESGKRA